MGKNGVSKTVFWKGVEGAVDGSLVDCPVLTQFFWAEYEDPVIEQFEILNDRQCLIGLTQSNAVGDDATIVMEDLIDRAFDTILFLPFVTEK